jgi:tRNA U34 5-carboxymethylaminomethyl modifying GTPase MnmE/TrmE
MQFTKIYNSQKQIIDEGMIVYFPSSISYNR